MVARGLRRAASSQCAIRRTPRARSPKPDRASPGLAGESPWRPRCGPIRRARHRGNPRRTAAKERVIRVTLVPAYNVGGLHREHGRIHSLKWMWRPVRVIGHVERAAKFGGWRKRFGSTVRLVRASRRTRFGSRGEIPRREKRRVPRRRTGLAPLVARTGETRSSPQTSGPRRFAARALRCASSLCASARDFPSKG
jgi:hypothetical protein